MTEKPPSKARLDVLLVDRGLAASRERARALIIAGRVLVNEQKVEKPGVAVAADAVIRMLGDDLRYVSRGGLKLEAALDHWQMEVSGRACLDVGASTGGFTDCLLQRGAVHVTAVDTGFGQIAMKLRTEPRVRLLSNGILACSTGRPGPVTMLFSLDGTGKTWSNATPIFSDMSTRYTEFLELAPGKLFVVYDGVPYGWKEIPSTDAKSQNVIYGTYVDVELHN